MIKIEREGVDTNKKFWIASILFGPINQGMAFVLRVADKNKALIIQGLVDKACNLRSDHVFGQTAVGFHNLLK